MSHRSPGAAGFTLVELVVAIVLAAIVAGFMVLFLDGPVQAYFAQTRRADLADSATRIAAAVAGDVRTALPNSLRLTAAGSRKALELLATEGVARYYGQGDKDGALGEELTVGIGHPVTTFGTLELFSSAALPSAPYLSVGNLGNPVQPTYDAYIRGNGVMTTTAVTLGSNPSASPPPPFVGGENLVTLGAPMTFQAAGAPAIQPSVHNAYLVSGPVSYVCDSRAGTFTRYSGYAVTSGQSLRPGGASALIAHDVSQCTFSIVAAPPGYAYGELAILTVTLSSAGEALQVFLEAPTEYSQ
ncbi:MAG TPA: type II secretion system protein [Steroidobacteraceae bacterium]|nr:type II secretion system protein [Steroidobacteraceae bacterium]